MTGSSSWSGSLGFYRSSGARGLRGSAAFLRAIEKARLPVLPLRHVREALPSPYRGCRVGEASHPGPPADGSQHSRAAARRHERALRALQQMRLAPPDAVPVSDTEPDTERASDTLSDATAFASPAASPRPTPGLTPLAGGERPRLSPAPGHVQGDVAPTQADEDTPPPSPAFGQPEQPATARPPWQCLGPPRTEPGEHNSWLFVPLLHAAAGLLSGAAHAEWGAHAEAGDRWSALVGFASVFARCA